MTYPVILVVNLFVLEQGGEHLFDVVPWSSCRTEREREKK